MNGKMLLSFALLSIYTCNVLAQNDIETIISYSKEDIRQVPTIIGNKYNQKTFEALDPREDTKIIDVRGKEGKYKLFENGFEYIDDASLGRVIKDIQNDIHIPEDNKPEAFLEKLKIPIYQMIKERYNAKAVVIYATRNKAMVPTEAAEQIRVGIHSDYSPEAAKHMFQNMDYIYGDHRENFPESVAEDGQWAFVHIWTPVSTMRYNHVAVADWTTVDVSKTFAVGFEEHHPKDGCRHWLYDPKNEWYFKSNQNPGEFLLYTQYKNRVPGGMTLPHSGVAQPKVGRPTDNKWNKGFEIRVAMVFNSD